jgi:spore coat protein A
MVNGKVWPNMNVKQGVYRLRLLDGSNARFYNLYFENGMSFTQIATDGGFLKESVELTSLRIAPGERAEILVDFSGIPEGTTIRLLNDANGPFPDGDPVNPDTMGQIMQFTVTGDAGYTLPEPLPMLLNPTLAGVFPTFRQPQTRES